MSSGWSEVWVTFVENDESVLNALILAKSIKKTYSYRPVLVIHGPQISDKNRQNLCNSFDGVIQVDASLEWMKDDLETCAKIHLWSLPGYRKCVYFNSNSIVLENCDELFENKKQAAGKLNEQTKSMDSFVLVLSPNTQTYHEIIDKMNFEHSQDSKEKGKQIFENLLKTFLSFETVGREYITMQSEESKIISGLPSGTNGISKNVNFSSLRENKWTAYRDLLVEEVLKDISAGEVAKTLTPNKEPIAIVGMACRFPEANNPEELWNLMINKKDAMKPLPNDRWTPEQSCFVDEKDRKVVGGWLNCPVDAFDGKFFGISPAELAYVDPQQRFLLEIIWEALEDAAIDPYTLEGSKLGIFNGQWRTDYKELMIQSGFQGKELFRTYMGNTFGMTTARPAQFLGAVGPNICTESGCSSSITAVGMAMQSLQNNESNIALASGTNLILLPYYYETLKHLIAEDGHSKAFDASADGFARAEGCAILVLKRLSDAVRNGDKIHALLKGYGVAQEGQTKSMGTPTIKCEAEAMSMALRDSNVLPSEVSYVEAHGTGTPVGDPMEMKAIAQVYSAGRKEPLVVGSVKTNIGHTESCSGIAGIIKTVLAFQHEMIPPHRSLDKLNPDIDLALIPSMIPLEAVPWKRTEGKPRLAGVSSFGITGTDAHVILEEAPRIVNKIEKDVDNSKASCASVLTLSAKNEEALDELLEKYEQYLDQHHDELNIRDVTFTANTGRAHFNHRAAIVGQTSSDFLNKIKTSTFERSVVKRGENPKVCFLFTGQGSQYPGMGQTLYKTNAYFRSQLDFCSNILETEYKMDLRKVMWGEDKELIHDSTYSQMSVFVIEYCLAKLWEFLGIVPDCVLGHSLGEFAAATVAGILDVKDAIKLVATRCHLIGKLPQGRMIVIKANDEYIEKLIKEFQMNNPSTWLDFAAINSPEQTTLSGSVDTVLAFAKFCEGHKIKTHLLDATQAFHSRDMDPFLDEYRQIAKATEFKKPKCKYISGLNGKLLETDMDGEYWVRHVRYAVNFQKASLDAYRNEYRTFLEVGPHPVCCAILSRNVQEIQNSEPLLCRPSLRRSCNDWDIFTETLTQLYLGGFDVNWNNFHKYDLKNKVKLPHYPFQRSKHWFSPNLINPLSMGTESNKIHPLVGCALQTPSTQKIFQNFVNINEVPYVSDHKVDEHVIFPAAGYLEMSLAAGRAVLNSEQELSNEPSKIQYCVSKFEIKAPLELIEDKTYEMQTLVDLVENEAESLEAKVTIYSRKRQVGNNNIPWTCHSVAVVSVIENKQEINSQEKLISTIKNQTKSSPTVELYISLAKLGYNFGPTFQSLKNIWKMETEFMAEISNPVNDTNSEYMCHPTTLDAMIQASLITDNPNLDSLYLPVSINECKWLKKIESTVAYIYIASNEVGNEKCVQLLDDSGEIVAIMKGISLVKTSIKNLQKALGSDSNSLLPMFIEEWRTKEIVPTEEECIQQPFLKDAENMMASKLSKFTNNFEHSEELKLLNKTIGLGVMLSLQTGFKSIKVGDIIDLDKFMKDTKIIESARWMLSRSLEMLVEDGYLQKSKICNAFEVKREIPSVQQLTKEITKNMQQPQRLQVEWKTASVFLSKFSNLLTGKSSALDILFPETAVNEFSAEKIYKESEFFIQGNQLLEASVELLLANRLKTQVKEKSVIKILEIGSGTGSATSKMLPLLEKHNINFAYTFTDISPSFLSKAKFKFNSYIKHMHFQTLNVEEDPKLQGFSPHEFDLVVASNVLHATLNLTDICRNIRHLLKKLGLVLILETFIPQRFLDIAFGHLDGYCRFTDFELRSNHCVINPKKWTQILDQTDFPVVTSYELYEGGCGVVLAEASNFTPQYKMPLNYSSSFANKVWIVYSDDSLLAQNLTKRLEMVDRSIIIVQRGTKFQIKNPHNIKIRPSSKEDAESVFKTVATEFSADIEGVIYAWGHFEDNFNNSSSIEDLTRSYLYLLQTIISSELASLPRVYLLTQNQLYVTDEKIHSPTSSLLIGMSKSFKTENASISCKTIDVEITTEIESLFSELWKEHDEAQVVYRQGVRYVARLTSSEVKSQFGSLSVPTKGKFSLVLPSTKTIGDLKFGRLRRNELEGNEVEIQIKSAGLNFKDVFNVLKPTAEFENSNSVGADFAGIVVAVGKCVKTRKIGDAVLGCNLAGDALPSHTSLPEDQLVPLPDEFTFAEGATLPCTFATAYHCLISSGKLAKGETILIHTASGGVGLCAVQLAFGIGANVIATAGSNRKREYLRSLGIKHVFNSRDLTFGEKTLKVTENKGVNMVLNSLTGPGFKETSLKCCSPNARFLEMSKLNIWTTQEVNALRPDVRYTIEDLSAPNPERWVYLMKKLHEFIIAKQIKPLRYTAFDAVNIRDALVYLQKAQQIGKVICNMPQTNEEHSHSAKTQLFNDRSSYLITGGTRGIGLEVAKWMAESGAKNLILCGRREPAGEDLKAIETLKQSNINVVLKLADIGNFEECKKLINSLEDMKLPPLRGIMHSAGCLSDGTIENQSWEKFQETINPKVNGTWNLHTLTLNNYNLEHFILFSSVAALLGPKGQSNHAACNTFMDTFAHYRRASGLPATSVNWGQWGETGIAAGKKIESIIPFSTSKGIATLEHILLSNRTQVGAFSGQFELWKTFFPWTKLYLEEVKVNNTLSKVKRVKRKILSGVEFWKIYNSNSEVAEKRYQLVQTLVSEVLKEILKFDASEEFSPNQPFQESGMDSLMIIEFRNQITLALEPHVVLNANDMTDFGTLHLLTNRILDLISTSKKIQK